MTCALLDTRRRTTKAILLNKTRLRFHALADKLIDQISIPETLQVVAISDMARTGSTGQDDELLPWLFFDNVEQRAKFLA